ncbi:MAG TPA: hypothetical protein VHO94_04230 [Oscillospiraceae bacterium]|nr:hypothetical protein [Oscillospiraceae bacterium]
MNIDKSKLKTLWYEDKDGNLIDCKENEIPENAYYQVSRFPQMLTETHRKLIRKDEVDNCKHPRKFRRKTSGWVDGIFGRECTRCGGTQTRKRFHFWPKKWDAYGSRELFEGHCTWNDEKTILAMVSSGDYTLSEAILVYTSACERCMNVLAYKYTNGADGYAEHSEEWKKCNTSCDFCKSESEAI